MQTFFKDIANRIEEAVKKDVKGILKEIGEEKVYGIALVTDSDCITLYLALNTYENMKKRDAKYIEMFHDNLPNEQIRNVKDGKTSFVKWVPDEWGYSDGQNSELSKISGLLYDKEESNSDEYAKHNDLFFEAVASAFKNLIEANVFGENMEGVTYFISMTDDDRAIAIENASAKLLNPENVYNDFLNRTWM